MATHASEQTGTSNWPGGARVYDLSLPFNRDRLLVYNDIPILCLMHERACDRAGTGIEIFI